MINPAKKILLPLVASVLLSAGLANAASKIDLTTDSAALSVAEKDFQAAPPCMPPPSGRNGGG